MTTQRRALEIAIAAHGEEHPTVADNLNNLASKLQDLGRYEEAEKASLRTLEIDLKLLGDDHPFVAMDRCNLASLYLEMDRYREAESLLQQALQLQEGNPDVSPINLASTLTTYGDLLLRDARFDEAEPLLQRAVEIREEKMSPDSYGLALARQLLGLTWLRTKKADDARALMESSFAIIQAKPAGHPGRESASKRMAELYETLGDTARARQLRERNILAEHVGATDPRALGWVITARDIDPPGKLDAGVDIVEVGPLAPDPVGGEHAWAIDDRESARHRYERNGFARPERWTMEATLRIDVHNDALEGDSKPVDSSTVVEYSEGLGGRRFGLNFGTDREGRPVVQLFGTDRRVTLDGGSDVYHHYELRSNGELWIDGIRRATGYRGIDAEYVPLRVNFGDGRSSTPGRTHWALVRFTELDAGVN